MSPLGCSCVPQNCSLFSPYNFWYQGGRWGISSCRCFSNHVKWVSCHHYMARPEDADGGDGLQIGKTAANLLNKQSRTADSRWPPSLRVQLGITTPPPTLKTLSCYESLHWASVQNGYFGTTEGPENGYDLEPGTLGAFIRQAQWRR
jgi:hypothetical protein